MRSRLSTDHPFTCVTCEIEITGPATFHVGLPFCCSGCAADGPCTCSYDRESTDARVRHCLDLDVAFDRLTDDVIGERVGAARQ
jgi:hypothetical protein